MIAPGSTLGPFKIQSLLGKGGMGEVFSALDTRLDRKVALKILPLDFPADPDRLRRFQSEAKTLASLNHPNILSICIQHGLPLFARDRHFDHIAQLVRL